MPNKKVPKFIPQPGQIDFSNARWAPVVNSVVFCDGEILIVERNTELNFYPGCWNGISGFLDDKKSLEEKVREELQEELGLQAHHIDSVRLCDVFDQEEPKYDKTWVVHAVLVLVNSKAVNLDWENTHYAWVTPGEALKHDLLPGFDRVIQSTLPFLT